MKKAILKTLAYADVFDYPFNEKEIYRFLISEFPVSNSPPKVDQPLAGKFQKELKTLSASICQKEGFYFLKGREKIVEIRKKREKWSREKFKIAERTAIWLKFIPTIKMVAVTGALSMNNSDRDDDIDFLIVTAKNRLWLTRLLATILVELVAKRRRPSDKFFKDKICLNMFLDEEHLQVPKKEQDLFSAHEVVQLKPIWDKKGIYNKFISQNQWVKKFLANGLNGEWIMENGKKIINYQLSIINCLENFARKIQLSYMSARRTTEVIEKGRIRFHPHDCRNRILLEYNNRLDELKIK